MISDVPIVFFPHHLGNLLGLVSLIFHGRLVAEPLRSSECLPWLFSEASIDRIDDPGKLLQ